MNLCIVGCRDYSDYGYFTKKVNEIVAGRPIAQIISGGASGADAMAEKYANDNRINVRVFPANWNKRGRAAGPIRNGEMADYVKSVNGEVIAFWDNKSTGTKNMIGHCQRLGIAVTIVKIP